VCFYRAKVALDECRQALIESSVKLPTVCISGVDHFQNAVIFAKVQPGEEFDQLLVITSMCLLFIMKLIISSVFLFHTHVHSCCYWAIFLESLQFRLFSFGTLMLLVGSFDQMFCRLIGTIAMWTSGRVLTSHAEQIGRQQ